MERRTFGGNDRDRSRGKREPLVRQQWRVVRSVEEALVGAQMKDHKTKERDIRTIGLESEKVPDACK